MSGYVFTTRRLTLTILRTYTVAECKTLEGELCTFWTMSDGISEPILILDWFQLPIDNILYGSVSVQFGRDERLLAYTRKGFFASQGSKIL